MSQIDKNPDLELYELIFENSVNAILLTSPKGEILKTNTCFKEIFGYLDDEILHKKLDIISPEFLKIFNELKDGKKEIILRDNHQNDVYCEVKSRHLKSKEDEFTVIFIKNITELKKTQQKLETSGERFKSLVENAAEALFIHDFNGKFVDVNKQACDSLGYTREELLSMNVVDIEEDFSLEDAQKEWSKIEIGKPFTLYGHQKRKNGEVFPVEVRFAVMEIEGERLYMGLVRDITDRRKAEEGLKFYHEWLGMAQKAAKSGFWDWDMETDELTWSPELYELFGIPEQKPSFDIWLELIHPDDRKNAMETINESISTNKALQNEYRIIKPNKEEIWIRALGKTEYNERDEALRMSGICLDITSEKEDEKKLNEILERETFLADIIRNASIAIGVGYPDGSLGIVNKAFEKLTGYSGEELSGLDWSNILTPEKWRIPEQEVLEKILKTKKSHTYEKEYIHKDGTVVPIEMVVHPNFDANGNFEYYFAFITDLSERKKSEKALQKSEEKYRMLYSAMNEGMAFHEVIYDEAGTAIDYKIIDVNPAFEEILGINKEDILGKKASKAYGVDEAPYLDIYVEVAETKHPQKFETYFENMEKYFRILAFSPINGFFATVFEDISKNKNYEKKLLESKNKLEAVIESMTDAVFVSDSEGNFVDFNDAFATFHKFKDKNEVYRKLADYPDYINVYFEDGSILPLDMWAVPRALRGETIIGAEYELERKDTGEKWWGGYSFSPIKDSEEKIIGSVVVARDITRRKERENQINKLLNELKRSNKDLESFAYIASHDLQEPLRSVSGFLQLLVRRYSQDLDPKALQYIDISVKGVLRMQTMIEDLLQFSRVSSRGKEFQSIDSEKTLQKVVLDLKSLITKNKAVVTHDNLPQVLADESQLAQVFQNLISNAIKFHGQDSPLIHISTHEAPDEWIFSVQDNGIGIEPKYHDQIFEVFRRLHTRQKYDGTGIGLAIVRKILERHRGRVWVESNIGEGSTFYFTLPRGESYE